MKVTFEYKGAKISIEISDEKVSKTLDELFKKIMKTMKIKKEEK